MAWGLSRLSWCAAHPSFGAAISLGTLHRGILYIGDDSRKGKDSAFIFEQKASSQNSCLYALLVVYCSKNLYPVEDDRSGFLSSGQYCGYWGYQRDFPRRVHYPARIRNSFSKERTGAVSRICQPQLDRDKRPTCSMGCCCYCCWLLDYLVIYNLSVYWLPDVFFTLSFILAIILSHLDKAIGRSLIAQGSEWTSVGAG